MAVPPVQQPKPKPSKWVEDLIEQRKQEQNPAKPDQWVEDLIKERSAQKQETQLPTVYFPNPDESQEIATKALSSGDVPDQEKSFLKEAMRFANEPIVSISQNLPQSSAMSDDQIQQYFDSGAHTPLGLALNKLSTKNKRRVYGVHRGMVQLAEGLTSPLNLGLIALGGVGAIFKSVQMLNTLANGVFAAEMGVNLVQNAPEMIENFQSAMEEGRPGDASEIAALLTGSTVMTVGAARHMGKGLNEKIRNARQKGITKDPIFKQVEQRQKALTDKEVDAMEAEWNSLVGETKDLVNKPLELIAPKKERLIEPETKEVTPELSKAELKNIAEEARQKGVSEESLLKKTETEAQELERLYQEAEKKIGKTIEPSLKAAIEGLEPKSREELFRLADIEPDVPTRSSVERSFRNITKDIDIKNISESVRQRANKLKEEPPVIADKTEAEISGLNKEEIRSIRERTELGDLPQPERQKWIDVLDSAKKNKLDEKATILANESLQTGRTLTPEEHAGMVLKKTILENEYDASIRNQAELIDRGNMSALSVEQARSNAILEEIDLITRGSRNAGTETARALAARRMAVTKDTYSLADLTIKAKASKGEKLSSKEHNKFKELADEHSVLQSKYEKLSKDFDRVKAEAEKQNATEVLDAAIKKRRKKFKEEEILEERTDLKNQLSDLGVRVNDITGLTAEGSYLIGKLGLNYVKAGAKTLGEVAQKLKKDIPEISDREINQALIATNPKAKRRARSETQKNIAAIKRHARILEQIELAEEGIFNKPKKRPPLPREIQTLKKKLTDLRSEAYRTGSEKLEKQIEKLNELQNQLDQFHKNIKKHKIEDPNEIQQIRDAIRSLRKGMSLQDRLKDLNQQMETGEFKIKPEPVVKELPPELELAEIQLKKKRAEIRNAINDLHPLGVGGWVSGTIDFARSIKATADQSALLNQLVMFVPRYPIKAAKSLAGSTKAFFKEHSADEINLFLERHPDRSIADRSGLEFYNYEGLLTERVEFFRSSLAEKLPIIGPIVKASNRSFVTAVNLMHMEVFSSFLKRHPNATRQELRAYADWINVATGSGNLGSFKGATRTLSQTFFAPKFGVSRFQAPFKVLQYWKEPRVRTEISKDMAAFAGTGASILGLAYLAGYDVGIDIRDSDWGKIKIGNTRIDIWGGFQQPMRFMMRPFVYVTDKAGLTGKNLTEQEKKWDFYDEVGHMLSYKFSPGVNLPVGILTGKTVVGEEQDLSEMALRSVAPFVAEAIYDAYKIDGPNIAFGIAGPTWYGTRTSTYWSKNNILKDFTKRRRLRGEDANYTDLYATVAKWNQENPARKDQIFYKNINSAIKKGAK